MPRPYPMEAEAAFSPFATRNTVLDGVAAKKQVIINLIEGHLNLLEAVAQFQAIHRSSTANLEQTLGVSPTLDAESLCRTVIGWIPLVLSDRPEQAEAITQRLEQELQTILERNGQVHLPAVA